MSFPSHISSFNHVLHHSYMVCHGEEAQGPACTAFVGSVQQSLTRPQTGAARTRLGQLSAERSNHKGPVWVGGTIPSAMRTESIPQHLRVQNHTSSSCITFCVAWASQTEGGKTQCLVAGTSVENRAEVQLWNIFQPRLKIQTFSFFNFVFEFTDISA